MKCIIFRIVFQLFIQKVIMESTIYNSREALDIGFFTHMASSKIEGEAILSEVSKKCLKLSTQAYQATKITLRKSIVIEEEERRKKHGVELVSFLKSLIEDYKGDFKKFAES